MKKICFLLALFFARAVHAQEMETDRPGESNGPHVVPQRVLQAELGAGWEKQDAIIDYFYPSLSLRYGLLKNLELRFETDWLSQTEHLAGRSLHYRGSTAPQAGFKWALADKEDQKVHAAIMAQAGLPRWGAHHFATPHVPGMARLLVQHEVSKNLSFTSNAGAAWNGVDGQPQWLYTLQPSLNISDRCQAFAELYGYLQPHAAPHHAVDGGVLYALNNNMQLDFSTGMELNKEAYHYFMMIGFSLRTPPR